MTPTTPPPGSASTSASAQGDARPAPSAVPLPCPQCQGRGITSLEAFAECDANCSLCDGTGFAPKTGRTADPGVPVEAPRPAEKLTPHYACVYLSNEDPTADDEETQVYLKADVDRLLRRLRAERDEHERAERTNEQQP